MLAIGNDASLHQTLGGSIWTRTTHAIAVASNSYFDHVVHSAMRATIAVGDATSGRTILIRCVQRRVAGNAAGGELTVLSINTDFMSLRCLFRVARTTSSVFVWSSATSVVFGPLECAAAPDILAAASLLVGLCCDTKSTTDSGTHGIGLLRRRRRRRRSASGRGRRTTFAGGILVAARTHSAVMFARSVLLADGAASPTALSGRRRWGGRHNVEKSVAWTSRHAANFRVQIPRGPLGSTGWHAARIISLAASSTVGSQRTNANVAIITTLFTLIVSVIKVVTDVATVFGALGLAVTGADVVCHGSSIWTDAPWCLAQPVDRVERGFG